MFLHFKQLDKQATLYFTNIVFYGVLYFSDNIAWIYETNEAVLPHDWGYVIKMLSFLIGQKKVYMNI